MKSNSEVVDALLESLKQPHSPLDNDMLRLRKVEHNLALEDAQRLLRRYFDGDIPQEQLISIIEEH